MVEKYDCDDLKNMSYIAEGSFGSVYTAELNGTTVAVKILHNCSNKDAIKEIRRMQYLDHENVVELIGTVPPNRHFEGECECEYGSDESDDEDDASDDDANDAVVTWLILEYMPNGNLLDYMQSLEANKEITAYHYIKFAHQVALGMGYLQANNVVHMDLAARNILVGYNYLVKIADFGLCDEYSQEDYYHHVSGKPCPIRWMPPENLPGSHGKFSRKGDVWSFGVVLFEIWTRGNKKPFSNLTNEQVITAVKSGNSVLNHDVVKCRKWVKSLMKDCFAFDKTQRPNFNQICGRIDENSEYDLSDDESSDEMDVDD